MTEEITGKPVIYQAFTRLFGNTNRTNKPWGTMTENGVGRFGDFTDTALQAIRRYGVSHIWYTGVPHHAVIQDPCDPEGDHPAVVKGRAGSPYAVRDYYAVNPDLASNPATALEEFEALVQRSHKHGLKVLIDIVPNHVARHYQSRCAPAGTRDFGADDDTHVSYARDNDFYYLPGEAFTPPELPDEFAPLGGQFDSRCRPPFTETPAKWTGNGARTARPGWDDWYETVKINYGVRPDGQHDFPSLPDSAATMTPAEHFTFWQQQSVPGSWQKFRDIALYWLQKGVDGFRFDMAEMVPVAFWSYLNSAIKNHNPDATVVAEVYQPDLYRDYIHSGKMDYLYDKVDLYDTLKDIIQQRTDCAAIDRDQHKLADIDAHLLRFLENHDEQRIASPEFAGSAQAGWPAMVITALLGQGPTLLYFGQAQGEAASEDLGFGRASRTTIFDYAGVPAHQDWMNDGAFDGALLSPEQQALNRAYEQLLSFSATAECLRGSFYSLFASSMAGGRFDPRSYAFVRQHSDQLALVITNFDPQAKSLRVVIPSAVGAELRLQAGRSLSDRLAVTPYQVELQADTNGDLYADIQLDGYSGRALVNY